MDVIKHNKKQVDRFRDGDELDKKKLKLNRNQNSKP